VLTFEQIKELIDLVTERELKGVEIERSGFRLRIEGKEVAQPPGRVTLVTQAEGTQPLGAAPEPAPIPAAKTPVEEPAESSDDHHVVVSPIVGTFYISPSPEADPYVRVGDRVKRGQVLCIIEAMKLMNEIESDEDGVIVQVFPKNAQPVEFGQALFAVEPD